MSDKKIYYKGFHKGLTCRGFQYKEGEWMHVSDNAELCKEGVHACEAPIDCFRYYNPAESEFHAVELDGVSEKRESDTKVVATDIKVGEKLSIKDLVDAHIEFVKSKSVRSESSTGYSAANSSTGDYAANSSTGYRSANSSTGYCAANSSTGYSAANSSTGDYAANSSTGYSAANSSTGDYAANSSTGYGSVNVGWGRGNKCKGAVGNYLVLSEWGRWDGKKYPLLCAKMAVVDGETIKADTWYMLKNGEFVEVSN